MEGKTLLSPQVDRWNGLEEVNVIENKSTPSLILRGGLCGKPFVPNGAVLQLFVGKLEIVTLRIVRGYYYLALVCQL